jgi:hypothetical protein
VVVLPPPPPPPTHTHTPFATTLSSERAAIYLDECVRCSASLSLSPPHLATTPRTQTSPSPSAPLHTRHIAATVHNNCLYVVGGRGGSTDLPKLKTVEMYHFDTGKWTILASEMSVPRYLHAVAVHDHTLYVVLGPFRCTLDSAVPGLAHRVVVGTLSRSSFVGSRFCSRFDGAARCVPTSKPSVLLSVWQSS